MGARALLLTLFGLAACGAPVEPAFCARAHSSIRTANQKGNLCLAQTSLQMENGLLANCEARITTTCDGGDVARMEQWLTCWDEIPACSSNGASALVTSGNHCANDAGLAEVATGCLALFGDHSR